MYRLWAWLTIALALVRPVEDLSYAKLRPQVVLQPQLRVHHAIRFTPWDLVTAVDWAPNGQLLAVAAGDSIYLYQTDNWQSFMNLKIGAMTMGLAFSPDGSWLAAGSRDGNLRLWQTSQLQQVEGSAPATVVLPAHRKGVNSVTFSSDSGLLASGGNDAIARIWDPIQGKLVGTTIGGSFAVPSIDFSLDGKVLAVINGDVLRLRQVGTERIVGTFQADAPLYHVRFSPDGKHLAVTAMDNSIRIWETELAYSTANPVYIEPIMLHGHDGLSGTYRALVWDVVFSPDGALLVSGGGDGTIRIWDPKGGTLLASYEAHPRGVTCLSFRSDGRALASGGLDGSVMIWEISQ